MSPAEKNHLGGDEHGNCTLIQKVIRFLGAATYDPLAEMSISILCFGMVKMMDAKSVIASHIILLFAAFMLTIGTVEGEEARKEISDNDVKELQGRWELVVFELRDESGHGVILPGTYHGDLTIQGEEAIISLSLQGTNTKLSYRIIVDSTKQPKHIDRVFRDKDGETSTERGIYQINKTELIWCVGRTGKSRPSTFEKGVYQVWKRKTEKVEGESGSAPAKEGNTDEEQSGREKGDLERLQGEWILNVVEHRGEYGKGSFSPMESPVKLVIRGKTATVHRTTQGISTTYSYVIALDSSTQPKCFDAHLQDDVTVKGIYEIRGNTLRRCLGLPGGPRPENFDVGVYYVWQRVVAPTPAERERSECDVPVFNTPGAGESDNCGGDAESGSPGGAMASPAEKKCP
jgi:uncharacterized protein (TIGR03067 family)